MLKEDKQTEINLSLWKQFNEEADKTKDRLWTIASWMFASPWLVSPRTIH